MSGKPIASDRLLKLARRWVRLANQVSDAEREFMELARKEFPDMEDDNDGIAENLTYRSFSNGPQTRKRLTQIIHGAY